MIKSTALFNLWDEYRKLKQSSKPVVAGEGLTHWFCCPKCHHPIDGNMMVCEKCGCKIEWTDGPDVIFKVEFFEWSDEKMKTKLLVEEDIKTVVKACMEDFRFEVNDAETRTKLEKAINEKLMSTSMIQSSVMVNVAKDDLNNVDIQIHGYVPVFINATYVCQS